MHRRFPHCLTALWIVISFCLSSLPWTAMAEAPAAPKFIRVTAVDEITAGGDFILIAATGVDGQMQYYALGTAIASKITGVPVTPETDAASLPVWRIGSKNGGVSLHNGESYLIFTNSTNLNSGETPQVWSVTEAGVDTFRFQAADTPRAIALQNSDSSFLFGCFALENADQTDIYTFDLMVYKLAEENTDTGEEPTEETTGDPTEEPPEEPTETPTEEPVPDTPAYTLQHLDQVYLYHPQSAMALTGNADGSKLSGTAVEVKGDCLISGEGMAELTVAVDADGCYAFLNSEGLYLTCGEAGGNLRFDPADDYSRWIVTPCEGGFLIRNAGAEYGGVEQALQYYYGFTTYGMGEDASYIFRFCKFGTADTLPGEQPEQTPPEPVTITPGEGSVYVGSGETLTLNCETEGAVIYCATSVDGVNFTEFAPYTGPLSLDVGFGRLWVRAYAQRDGGLPGETVTWEFTELEYPYGNLYFGQLHSHTGISDGTGTPAAAFAYGSDVAGLDFLAVTDHSNSFDNADSGVLSQNGLSLSADWAAGQQAAEEATDDDFVALYGFEMTWNNGLGHISTFNTPGWQSRNQEDYAVVRTGLENYYAALSTVPGSISQFNHPGTAYGDFDGFGHYSPEADSRITLIEVGNGDVNGNYETAYGYYNRALDLGWHLAPTSNQNNHDGNWGTASSCRTVVLAEALTPEGIYSAMGSYRVYATEDSDLHIYYTLDGCPMGTILEREQVGETVLLSVSLRDETDGEAGTVEVITTGGQSIASQAAGETVTFRLASAYPYYYIRVTQPDGDVAVIAPVWINQEETAGIRDFRAASEVTVAGESQTFILELYNQGSVPVEITGIVFTDKATGEVLYTHGEALSIPGQGTAGCCFTQLYSEDGVYTITATVQATRNGRELTFVQELEVVVRPKNITANIVIDGTHGNPGLEQLDDLTAMAEGEGLIVHVETNAITPDMLAGCDLLIVTAPATVFEDTFVEMVADYVKNGGNILLCGVPDTRGDGSEELNRLLGAVNATMTLGDDTVMDDVRNSGTSIALALTDIHEDTLWTEGVRTAASAAEGESHQIYRQLGGCTVHAGSGTWLVRGYDTTYAMDGDGDGTGGAEPGTVVLLTWEESRWGGNIFLAGGLFLTDEELGPEPENQWVLPSANRTILENILGITRTQPVVTPIGEVRAAALGDGGVFLIEGYVTAGTANPYTDMPDTIYIQDATGGIAIHGYAGPMLKIGTKVRITGSTVVTGGDIGMQVVSWDISDDPESVIEPEKLSNREAADYDAFGGELVQIRGEVISVIPTADGRGAAEFVLRDANGDLATVYVEAGVCSSITGENTLARFVKPGAVVMVTGLVYSLDGEILLRVRDCEEVVLLRAAPGDAVSPATGDGILLAVALMLLSAGALTLLRKKGK